MSNTAIKWLLYDLLRTGTQLREIIQTLHRRGATYADLVSYIVENNSMEVK